MSSGTPDPKKKDVVPATTPVKLVELPNICSQAIINGEDARVATFLQVIANDLLRAEGRHKRARIDCEEETIQITQIPGIRSGVIPKVIRAIRSALLVRGGNTPKNVEHLIQKIEELLGTAEPRMPSLTLDPLLPSLRDQVSDVPRVVQDYLIRKGTTMPRDLSFETKLFMGSELKRSWKVEAAGRLIWFRTRGPIEVLTPQNSESLLRDLFTIFDSLIAQWGLTEFLWETAMDMYSDGLISRNGKDRLYELRSRLVSTKRE